MIKCLRAAELLQQSWISDLPCHNRRHLPQTLTKTPRLARSSLPDPTSRRDNRSRLETEGAREREKGGGWRGQSKGGRVSERKGQTSQQQAWETLLISREEENSHHTAEWARLVVSRDWCEAPRMDVLQCWNSVYPLINNLHRRNWQDILTLKLEISQAPVW